MSETTIDAPPSGAPLTHTPFKSMFEDFEARVGPEMNRALGIKVADPVPDPEKPKPDAPPSKPTEKPAATAPTVPDLKAPEVDDAPKDMSAKAAGDWKRVKEKHKTELTALQTRLAEIEGELKSARGQAPKLDEIPEFLALKTERDQLSDALKVVDVEKHPKFSAYFDGETNKALAAIKSVVGEQKGAEFEKIIKLPDSEWRQQRLDELTSDLSSLKISQVGAALLRVNQIQSERASEVANARTNYERLQAQKTNEQTQHQAKISAIMEETLTRAQDPASGLAIFQKKEGDAAWNTEVDQRLALSRSIYSGKMDAGQLAMAATWAAAAPALLGQAKNLMETNAKLQAELQELKSAQPRGGGNHTPAPVSVSGNGIDQIVAAVERAGGFNR